MTTNDIYKLCLERMFPETIHAVFMEVGLNDKEQNNYNRTTRHLIAVTRTQKMSVYY